MIDKRWIMSVWRKVKPKSIVDVISVLYAQLLIHSGVIFGEFCVLPWLIEKYDIGLFKICMLQLYGGFIYFNVMGRIWKICLVNTSTVGKILPTLLKPGWFYCTICEANSPPRSFHCRTCNRCILKRDHHCMFTGKCIGYFNYAQYLYLVFYVWLGTMFAAVMGLEFTWEVLGGFSFYNIPYFVLPLVCFFLGYLDFFSTFVAFICLMASVFCMLLTALMIWHSKHVLHNMTTHERNQNCYIFDLGYKENFIGIFGTKWYLGMLFPTFHSPLPGDGIEFTTRDNYEKSKSL